MAVARLETFWGLWHQGFHDSQVSSMTAQG